MEEMGVVAINPARYGRLCADVLPKVIDTDAEFDRMVDKMEELDRKKNPTPEERTLSELLARLIEDYDSRKSALPDAPPFRIILHLMEQHGLRQADMLRVFGSRSVASEVLSGKREPSKTHIRKLADFFQLSPAVFL
jgi:HTH-type transcriptional regulator/antitoxin HigA